MSVRGFAVGGKRTMEGGMKYYEGWKMAARERKGKLGSIDRKGKKNEKSGNGVLHQRLLCHCIFWSNVWRGELLSLAQYTGHVGLSLFMFFPADVV